MKTALGPYIEKEILLRTIVGKRDFSINLWRDSLPPYVCYCPRRYVAFMAGLNGSVGRVRKLQLVSVAGLNPKLARC